MSESKLIGSCGIRVHESAELGPTVSLDPRIVAVGISFTLERDDGETVTMGRDEVRDLLPLLIAFADGAS